MYDVVLIFICNELCLMFWYWRYVVFYVWGLVCVICVYVLCLMHESWFGMLIVEFWFWLFHCMVFIVWHTMSNVCFAICNVSVFYGSCYAARNWLFDLWLLIFDVRLLMLGDWMFDSERLLYSLYWLISVVVLISSVCFMILEVWVWVLLIYAIDC